MVSCHTCGKVLESFNEWFTADCPKTLTGHRADWWLLPTGPRQDNPAKEEPTP